VVPTSFPAAVDGPERVRLYVLLSPLPSSWVWRRPRGLLVLRRGRTLAAAACITPRSFPTGAAAQPPPVRLAIEALRAIHLHLHGVSAEDLAAMMESLEENARRAAAMDGQSFFCGHRLGSRDRAESDRREAVARRPQLGIAVTRPRPPNVGSLLVPQAPPGLSLAVPRGGWPNVRDRGSAWHGAAAAGPQPTARRMGASVTGWCGDRGRQGCGNAEFRALRWRTRDGLLITDGLQLGQLCHLAMCPDLGGSRGSPTAAPDLCHVCAAPGSGNRGSRSRVRDGRRS
jgi:hypothetical protein